MTQRLAIALVVALSIGPTGWSAGGESATTIPGHVQDPKKPPKPPKKPGDHGPKPTGDPILKRRKPPPKPPAPPPPPPPRAAG